MNPFKIGDKVRIISNDCDSVNKVGSIGKVTAVTSYDCRVQVEGNPSNGNFSPLHEIELVGELSKCSKCNQELPDKTELELVTEGLRQVYKAIDSGDGKFSCCEVGRYLPKLRTEYEAFIKPLIIGSTFKGVFESKRVRLAMITMFAAKKKAELE